MKNYISKMLVLFGFILVLFTALSWADNNGVWTRAEDVRAGTFGSDEGVGSAEYRFIDPVVMEDELNVTGELHVETIRSASGSDIIIQLG